MITAEYIWIDGTKPTATLRSKTKILRKPPMSISDFPEWGADGSSTEQATTESSDCILKPVCAVRDPLRIDGFLVLCEVFTPKGPHPSNTRASLRELLENPIVASVKPMFGLEQEYFMLKDNLPLGGPAPDQGPNYCGVGAGRVTGRSLVEKHMQACLDASLMFEGVNFEVCRGQAEFQVGAGDPLLVSDHLWIARWLLQRLGEDEDITISYHPKPVAGRNGSGCHTNYSDIRMRGQNGLRYIEQACALLAPYHAKHIAVYGDQNDLRLTGKYETSSIDEFGWGVGHRGKSIRIPASVAAKGSGYFEDRRPAANIDPYQVCHVILHTLYVEKAVESTVKHSGARSTGKGEQELIEFLKGMMENPSQGSKENSPQGSKKSPYYDGSSFYLPPFPYLL